MKNVQFPFYFRLTLNLLCIVLIIFLLYIGQGLFIPLFFAVYISFLLYPVAIFLEKRFRFSRSMSSLVAVSGFIIILAAFLYFITYQLLLFSPDIPLLQKQFNTWMQSMQVWISREYHIDSSHQMVYINTAVDSMLSNAGNTISVLFISISGILFWTVIIFIYTYFMLHHRRLIFNFIIALFADENKEKVTSVVMETRAVANNYLVGLFIEFIVVTIANCTAFAIMNVPYWLLLGLLAAILNFIPYLGFITATIMVLLVTVMHGSVYLALQAAVVLFIIHLLDANILLPRIVGQKVKMNALVTIISVLAGGALWGVAGMFLSIPVCATLKIIFERVDGLKAWAILMGIDDTETKK